jgi:hypothetical protein
MQRRSALLPCMMRKSLRGWNRALQAIDAERAQRASLAVRAPNG